MTDKIIKLREQLVGMCSDKIEAQKLLDQLEEAVEDRVRVESEFYVGKKDILETKDEGHYRLHRTKSGFLMHYVGGYSILVDDRMRSVASALDDFMEGVPADVTDPDEIESYELAYNAIEMVMRLPMFVFSNPSTTFAIAEMGTRYLLLLQKMGAVPTDETANPEYDRFLSKMYELLDDFATGMEKENLEYERRNGIDNGESKREIESSGEDKGEGKTQA